MTPYTTIAPGMKPRAKRKGKGVVYDDPLLMFIGGQECRGHIYICEKNFLFFYDEQQKSLVREKIGGKRVILRKVKEKLFEKS